MVQTGHYNELKIIKRLDFGVYLQGNEDQEILLPRRYVPRGCKTGDTIEVFIYLDSSDKIIATTQKPFASVGEIAYLKVVETTKFGTFLDWGLPKDLLVPFKEQIEKMREGRKYLVKVYLDEKTGRIAASAKIRNFLDKTPHQYNAGDKVDLIISNSIDFGYNVVIDQKFSGILFQSDVFQKLQYAEKLAGFILKIREDRKIDVCLHKPGYEKIEEISQLILEKLRERDGFLPVTDKSNPQIIYNLFKVSKKTYKKAVGALYKNRLIKLENNGIHLI
jgi:predicted RNA-binding protein (virulence factor B family)